MGSICDSEAPALFDGEIRWEKRWWEKGLHGVERGADHVVVCLMVAFDFAIGG